MATLDLDDPVAVALLTMAALRAAGVGHALYGGLLAGAYGEARETRDADVAVLQADPHLLLEALRDRGLRAAVSFEGVRFGGLVLTRIGLLGGSTTTGVNSIDLVAPRSERFARAVLARSLESPLRGERVRVVSPEDYVLLKVLSTRDRDLEDAAAVLVRMRGELDQGLLEREIGLLAAEQLDVDVAGRWQLAVGRVRR